MLETGLADGLGVLLVGDRVQQVPSDLLHAGVGHLGGQFGQRFQRIGSDRQRTVCVFGHGGRGLLGRHDAHTHSRDQVEVVEASHPVPDERGVTATRRILSKVSDLTTEDTVVCLLSGGGSSLLCAPAPGITLAEKRTRTAELLRSGAPIHEINAARRDMSAVKGGKLAAACAPANVITLIISDVPGNDPSVVLTTPDYSGAVVFNKGDDSVSLVDAAALPVNYLTAWQMLRVMAPPAAGETVLIHSAAGGVGQAALQLATLAGLEGLARASIVGVGR